METQVNGAHPLEAARNRAELSREVLAARAGVASRTIYGIEREGRKANRATLKALAEVLELTEDDLRVAV